MRVRGAVAIIAVAFAGCGNTACKDKTVFVSFSLAGLAAADGADISVSIGGGTPKVSHVALPNGVAKPSVEVAFPNGYPSGQTVTVDVDIKAGALLVGSGSATVSLTGKCAAVSVALTAAATANKHQGDSCGPDDICDTGNCVDGYCCDSPCTGQCQACDVASSIGTCITIADRTPHGTRSACNGTSTCGGVCDGASAMTCTYPPSSVICGAACDGHCDAMGGCTSVAGGSCPNGFACGSGGCDTSCSSDADCQPNFHCMAPNCVRVAETDCLDGKDNNGDGLSDCQDPTCNAQVSCVPSAPSGDELGILDAAACPNEFPTTEVQHQNLNAPACDTTGCNCLNYVSCQVTFSYSSATDCSSPKTLTQTLIQGFGSNPAQYPGNMPACSSIVPQAVNSMSASAVNYVNTTCTGTGTKTPPATSWGTSSNFCAVGKTSATCDSTHVCAPLPPSSQTMCVRVPQAGASCPAGYGGQSATWYSQVMDTRTCSCGCSVTQAGNCGSPSSVELQGHSSTSCPLSLTADPGCDVSPGGGCSMTSSNPLFGCALFGTVGAIGATTINANVGQCGNTISNNGSATPAGGSTICCQ